MRKIVAFLCLGTLLVAATWASVALAIEGGTKDAVTGLVWSPSLRTQTGSSWIWTQCQSRAADYFVTEGGITYADWRVATIKELLAAYNNGVMENLAPRSADGKIISAGTGGVGSISVWHVWSADWKGNKAWLVKFPVSADGSRLAGTPILELTTKNFAIDSVFVRP